MTYTFEMSPHLQPLNANDRMHWAKRSALTRDWRTMARFEARRARIPALQRIQVDIEICFPDKRRREVANLHPTAKACVDGIVDAGIVVDDRDEIVSGPFLHRGPQITGRPLWRFTITPLETP